MAVVSCKECGGQVATSAKACPHCGAKVQKKVGILGWIFVIFIVLPVAWHFGKNIGQAPSATVAVKPITSEPKQDVPAPPAQPVNKWSRNEYKDAMTDEKKVVLSARSLNAAMFDFPYRVPGGSYLTMSLRKQGNRLDAYFSIDKGQMLCSYNDCNFSLRVGNGAVQTWTGLRSSTYDSDIMFVRDAKQLEDIVKKGGRIRVGIDFHNAGTQAFDFEVDGYPGF